MKKFNKVLVVLSLVLVMLFAFAACGLKPGEGTVTIVLQPTEGDAQEYCVKTADVADYKNAWDLLKYVGEQENFEVKGTDGQYGIFIEQIGSLKPDTTKEFIKIMTSVEKDFQVENEYGKPEEKTYKKIKLVDSGVGIYTMTVVDGALFFF